MDKIREWLEAFDCNRALDYSSFLLIKERDFELDLSDYIRIDIEDGKDLYNMIDKCVRTTLVAGDKKKLLYMDGSVVFDKGVIVGIKNTIKRKYKTSIPIIVDMIDDKSIDKIFNRRCNIIEDVRDVPIADRIEGTKNIEIYKRRLFIECFGLSN